MSATIDSRRALHEIVVRTCVSATSAARPCASLGRIEIIVSNDRSTCKADGSYYQKGDASGARPGRL
jgi:hypothetical protein